MQVADIQKYGWCNYFLKILFNSVKATVFRVLLFMFVLFQWSMNKFFRLANFFIILVSATSACNQKDDVPTHVRKTVVHNASFTGFINQPFVVDFLANDTINERATINISQMPKHGGLKFDTQLGKYHYLPDYNFIGIDSFFYEVSIAERNIVAKVTMSILEMPCSHIATNDFFIVQQGRSAELNVLQNDKICGLLSGVTLEGTVGPNCALTSQRTIQYHPLITSGKDTIRYALHSHHGIESEAMVIIRVIP
jgi:hypothetical protein